MAAGDEDSGPTRMRREVESIEFDGEEGKRNVPIYNITDGRRVNNAKRSFFSPFDLSLDRGFPELARVSLI